MVLTEHWNFSNKITKLFTPHWFLLLPWQPLALMGPAENVRYIFKSLSMYWFINRQRGPLFNLVADRNRWSALRIVVMRSDLLVLFIDLASAFWICWGFLMVSFKELWQKIIAKATPAKNKSLNDIYPQWLLTWGPRVWLNFLNDLRLRLFLL